MGHRRGHSCLQGTWLYKVGNHAGIEDFAFIAANLKYSLRGAELSWQGYPIKFEGENIEVAVHEINCTGDESSLSECKVAYTNDKKCNVSIN